LFRVEVAGPQELGPVTETEPTTVRTVDSAVGHLARSTIYHCPGPPPSSVITRS